MKLSASNIAWPTTANETVFPLLSRHGYLGVELAPTTIFPDAPYEHLREAAAFAETLESDYGLVVSSIQSIWYGRDEQVFGSQKERDILLDYTRRAIGFSVALGCRNLVFGSPKNRVIPPDMLDDKARRSEVDDIAYRFFSKIADYAATGGVVIALEPNPVIYGTNFINHTEDAVEFVRTVGSKGLRVNLDFGTLVMDGENLDVLKDNLDLIHHVHISEPRLLGIEHRASHRELSKILNAAGYPNFVSIEMSKTNGIEALRDAVVYVKDVFSCE